MPFTKAQPEDLSHLRDMAYGWGKVVSRRAYGEEGPGLDLDFDSIESLAVEISQAVIRGAIEETLTAQEAVASATARLAAQPSSASSSSVPA